MNHKHSKTNNQPRTTNYKLLTTKKELRKIHSFIQNKANLPKAQINVNKVLERDYGNVHLRRRPKTKPKQTQSNPIYEMPKMNVSSILSKDYENICLYKRGKNKPNQSQSKPNFTPIFRFSFFYTAFLSTSFQQAEIFFFRQYHPCPPILFGNSYLLHCPHVAQPNQKAERTIGPALPILAAADYQIVVAGSQFAYPFRREVLKTLYCGHSCRCTDRPRALF